MAKFEIEGVDELMRKLSSLQVETLAPKMLEGSVPVLSAAVKRRAAQHRRTGDMLNSIKETKAKAAKDGHSISVRPTGKGRDGVRNMEKMAYLEYGTSKQAAAPVLTPAVNESRDRVAAKMQEVFEREAKL